MKRHNIRTSLFLAFSLTLTILSAALFLRMRQPEPIMAGDGVTRTGFLSDYFAGIKGTRGDSEIYILEGDTTGGAALILGGAHPNEPAGFIAAVCLIENIRIYSGKLIILPRANNSGFTHNDPQEGNPQKFFIKTPKGNRWFRYGSRSTNPIDQWPDPEVYLHHPSGQKLSGAETRNLNRSYPGKPNGTLTEKVAYAIMEMMKQEKVNIAIDLHEASLEYPVINAVVAHPLAFDLAAEVVMYLQMAEIDINIEPSPENFRGLSHREWGDFLGIHALLLESGNPIQGRYHGKVTADLIVSGKDKFNLEAAQHGLLEVEYPEQGIPIKERVGRHIISVQKIFEIWNSSFPDKQIILKNIPDYQEIQNHGLGVFLN